MQTSDSLFERARKVAPGGVHSPVRSFKGLDRAPVFFKSGEGAYLTSVEGKRYIDFCMSFGPLLLGHRDPDVVKAVHEMVDTAWTFGACEPYSLELGEWIQSKIPWVERLRFVSSGTEAVMSALRVARAATGKRKVLKFEGCYHGHVDSLLVKAGSGLAGVSASSSAGVPAEVAEFTLVAPLDDEAAIEKVFAQHGKDIAVIVIEPLPANYGLLPQRIEFLQFLRKVCDQYNCLLMFDEVISGFRVALGGMAEVTKIRPDLITYGKIIGGGFPVGCYGGRKDLMDQVAPLGPVYQAGTLSANPIGMRAGLVSLQKMEKLDIWNQLNKRTETWAKNLNQELKTRNSKFELSYYSSLFWFHDRSEKPIRRIEQLPAKQGENFKGLFLKALEKEIYLAPNAYEVGFMSWPHSETLLADVSRRLLGVIDELEG